MVWCDLGIQMELQQGIPAVIQIENPQIGVRVLREFQKQIAGQEGEMLFSHDEKEINLAKEAELIFNPLLLEFANRQLQTKLYQELGRVAGSMPEETTVLRAAIVKYMDKLLMQMPYQIDYDDEFDIIGVFKLTGLQSRPTSDELEDLLIDYIRLSSQLCRRKIFVFLNLSLYFTKQVLDGVLQSFRYLEIYPILIELHNPKSVAADIIIDEEQCVIVI